MNRRATVFGLVLSMMLSAVPAALCRSPQNRSEQEVAQLEAKRFRAMQDVDMATLESILSDDLVYTHSNGLRQTKSEFLGMLGSGDLKYQSIKMDETRVHVYGETAVIAGRATVEVKARGEIQNMKLTYLDVYVKQEGRWQMVAWQSARVAQ